MRGLPRLLRYEPYAGGHWELFLVRLFLIAMLLYKGDFLFGLLHSNGLFDKFNYSEMPAPHALGRCFDFTWIYAHHQLLKTGLWVASALFVAGVLTLPAISYILVLAIGIGTLRNSQGHIHHGTQMMALTILAITIGYLTGTLRNFKTRKWRVVSSLEDHRLAYLCAVQAIAAYYFVAGFSKIEIRGLKRWITELPNMGLYVDRNGHQQYLAGGGPEAYERSQAIAGWINEHPLLTTLLFAPGLLVELAAPAALLNRRLAFMFGILLLGFHILVGYVMQLSFPMNELLILIFLVNVPFLIVSLPRLAARIAQKSPGQ